MHIYFLRDIVPLQNVLSPGKERDFDAMRHKKMRNMMMAAAAAVFMALCQGCNGVYLGVGGNVGIPFPGGSVNLNVGTTVPVVPPVDYRLPGYVPAPAPGWHAWHQPAPWQPWW